MKIQKCTPESIAIELLGLLRVNRKIRPVDRKKLEIAEYVRSCVPGPIVLDMHHAFGLSISQIATLLRESQEEAQQEYDHLFNNFIQILRRYGWIRFSEGKWIFDPDAITADNVDLLRKGAPTAPPLPENETEACLFFGVEPWAPREIKMQAIGHMAEVVAHAKGLVLSVPD